MPVTEAISMVAREYSGPIGEEMERVYNAQKLGETLPDAVQKMTLRVPLPEVQMFATAITIQVQTGSSLSEVLGNLSGVIRGRFALKRKIQALSSEARISAMIIGSIPIILTGVLYLVNRDYIMLLFTDPTGKMLTGIAVGMMLVGAAVMRQMINMKV
jgi:tight adherence protein B